MQNDTIQKLAQAALQASQEFAQMAETKEQERALYNARLYGKPLAPKQSNVYGYISGPRVKRVKGYDINAERAARKRAKRAKALKKRQAKAPISR